MKDFVLDASIALAWCFADETTPGIIKLLDKLEVNTAYVPAIWQLEVGNILVAAERKRRITYAGLAQFLGLLDGLNIQTDQETAVRGFREIISLAHAEHLTTYDAAYLELALRLGLPLATKDKKLSQVAKKLGLALFELL